MYSAAEARIYVLVNYRNAYDDKRSIQSHIKQASDNSASAREAVRKAGQNYRGEHAFLFHRRSAEGVAVTNISV